MHVTPQLLGLIKAASTVQIDPQVQKDVLKAIADYNRGYYGEQKKYKPEHNIYDDLCWDELSKIEAMETLLNKYPTLDPDDPDFENAQTIQDLLTYVQKYKKKEGNKKKFPKEITYTYPADSDGIDEEPDED